MNVRSVRGTHDILPGSVELWQEIEEKTRLLFRRYGYGEIRTPILEETNLFCRSLGQETDIVQKEMYTIPARRGRDISLRPEGTAPVVRSYLENHLNRESRLTKLYYVGPMFRRERPQKGRYRQFHQIGAEVLGSDHPGIEAEVMEMLHVLLDDLGVRGVRLLVNSVGCPSCRPAYVRLLQSELLEEPDLCEECRRRAQRNPLRVLDCKKQSCSPAIGKLPSILEHLCPECREHFGRFRELLDLIGISYSVTPRLVRGLDYYVRTTFEVVTDRLGPTQNALLGGGRYDGLSELLEGPAAKGFGFGLGLERLVLLLSQNDALAEGYRSPRPEIFLAYLNEESLEKAFTLARDLRREGVFAYMDFGGRRLRAQMRLANRLGSRFVCVIGDDEIRTGLYSIKRMADGTQTRLRQGGISQHVKSA